MPRPHLLLAATVILCFTPGLAMADDMGTMKMGTMKMDTEQTAGSPADKAFTQSMRKMMKNMDVKPTGKTDRDFVIMMMPHHQGAIDMAKVELKYGKDPMLLKLAADIVEAQEKEIAEMKAWLAGNGN